MPSRNPPPRTRSNSAVPVVLRLPSSPLTWARATGWAEDKVGWPGLALGSSSSWVKESQVWQTGHWPSHFNSIRPHSWQR